MNVSALVCVLLLLTILPFPTTSPSPSPRKGPRTDELIIYWYPNMSAAYGALKSGQIDIVLYSLGEGELFEDAITDPSIQLAPVAYMNMYQIDINNNWTIPTYSGIRSPTSYLGFRRAMAYLTDKDYIVDTIFEDFAERIDQPIAAPNKGWMNESYMYPNYPYGYDPVQAAATLDAAGFTQGTTPNPYYDPAFPGSAEYIRVYPPDHPKAGDDLDPIIGVHRLDDIRRLHAGRLLMENLRKSGVPVEETEGDIMAIDDKVFGNRDYHYYTGGWSPGRLPTYVYSLYHSRGCMPYGYNYVTLFNSTGQPNYPDLDELLAKVYFAESYDMALKSLKNAMGLFTEYCITIPLWSDLSYWAYSSDLLGVVNMDGYGPENPYTFMNAYKRDGSALKVGLRNARAMNILYSDWYFDLQNLKRMYMWAGISRPPYDIAADQPGWIQDWHTSTWFDPEEGLNKTKLTLWFRKDDHWVKSVTGGQGPVVDAWDVMFSGLMTYAFDDCRYYHEWRDVHHINIVDNSSLEVYYDAKSYWLTYRASGPIIPRHVWLQPPIASHRVEYFHEGTNVTTPGVVPLSGKPVWIESVTADGVPLEQFIEWNWVKGGLTIFVNLTDCTDVYVDYWAAGDAKGYTPGDLPWETIFEGSGMYYVRDFDRVGGFLELRRNPYYWMETPPLGEIDFVWKWGPRDSTRPAPEVPEGPRTGYYKIDIYDIVLAAGAYGSQGTAIPGPYWFPGADLAPPGGRIDIYDIVTICAKYGKQFGHPPKD